jgi:hypothetical protein
MFDQFIETLSSPEVGGVLILMTALLVADFLTGVSRAFRLKVFEWKLVADFLGTHVAGRWLGIAILVALSPASPAILAVSGLAVAAYTAESLASIRENVMLPAVPPA